MQIYSVRLAKDKGPDYRGFVLVSYQYFKFLYYLQILF